MVNRFVGVEPWSEAFPRVEFETPHGTVDLHNNARFDSLAFSVPDAVLTLEFVHHENWRLIEESGTAVRLEFGGVTGLVLNQSDTYDFRAAQTLEGIVHSRVRDESRFEIDLGDLVCSFGAASMSLVR